MEKKLLLSTFGVPAAPASVSSPKEPFCSIPAWLKEKKIKNKTGRENLGLHGGEGWGCHLKPFFLIISYFQKNLCNCKTGIFYRRELSHFRKEVL